MVVAWLEKNFEVDPEKVDEVSRLGFNGTKAKVHFNNATDAQKVLAASKGRNKLGGV